MRAWATERKCQTHAPQNLVPKVNKSSYSLIVCCFGSSWDVFGVLLDLQDHLLSLDHIGNWARHFALKPWRDFQASAPQTCCREAPSDVASDLVLLLEDLAGRSSDGASPRQKCCQQTEFQSPGKANIHQTSWARGAAMWQKSEWNTSQGVRAELSKSQLQDIQHWQHWHSTSISKTIQNAWRVENVEKGLQAMLHKVSRGGQK